MLEENLFKRSSAKVLTAQPAAKVLPSMSNKDSMLQGINEIYQKQSRPMHTSSNAANLPSQQYLCSQKDQGSKNDR